MVNYSYWILSIYYIDQIILDVQKKSINILVTGYAIFLSFALTFLSIAPKNEI